MSNKFLFLGFYYIKNAVLMKIVGRSYGFFLGHMEKKWQHLHESIKGHDTWLVVGNGPSLRIEDLEAFKSIPSIASNKINILYGKTGWRPVLYTIADPLLLHKLPAEHFDNLDLVLLPHTHALMARTTKRLLWRHLKNEAGEEKYIRNAEYLSPLNGIFIGGTITVPNLQLAIWAGAKTIYVIGCDHYYSHENLKTGTRKSAHQGLSNHFDPNYRKPGEIVNEAPIDVMNRGYAAIRQIADKRGVRIVNISRRTALEAFERDTVENALAEIAGKAKAVRMTAA